MPRPDPSVSLPLRHRLEAAAARAFMGAMSGLSVERASAWGGKLGRAVGPLSSAHRTMLRNLERALPELDAAARHRVATDAWDNFGRTMTEYAVLPRLAATEWRERITMSGHEALVGERKPAILFAGHLGNWETIPIAVGRMIRPMTIVYRPPNNPAVDAMIADIRGGYTTAMAPKGAGGARVIMKALQDGELVLMIVDQKINEGLPIPFFGRDAMTGPAVARLAMRFNCPLVPVRAERRDGGRFHVSLEEPWTVESAGKSEDDAVRDALIRINAKLESWIRQDPGQWLWMHKRWPKEV
jgi:KDO2-lipid IV(A) lauroyltransferase